VVHDSLGLFLSFDKPGPRVLHLLCRRSLSTFFPLPDFPPGLNGIGSGVPPWVFFLEGLGLFSILSIFRTV